MNITVDRGRTTRMKLLQDFIFPVYRVSTHKVMSMKKELQYKNGLYLVKTDPTWLVFFIIVKIILIFYLSITRNFWQTRLRS